MTSSKQTTVEEKKTKEIKPKKTPKKKTNTSSTTKANPEEHNNKASNGTVSDSDDVVSIPSPAKSAGSNKRTADTKSKKDKPKKQKLQEEEVNDVVDKDEDAKTHRFPMNRIKMIIRSEDSDLRITHEALFVINKATEKFLEQFTNEAYACCVQDRKKSLAYKHLSSAVCKTRRFDFLSDFVPEKIKAEDALAEIKLAETEAS
ncbi:DNA polymerase epsilon subunit C-like [Fagus crenata]